MLFRSALGVPVGLFAFVAQCPTPLRAADLKLARERAGPWLARVSSVRVAGHLLDERKLLLFAATVWLCISSLLAIDLGSLPVALGFLFIALALTALVLGAFLLPLQAVALLLARGFVGTDDDRAGVLWMQVGAVGFVLLLAFIAITVGLRELSGIFLFGDFTPLVEIGRAHV